MVHRPAYLMGVLRALPGGSGSLERIVGTCRVRQGWLSAEVCRRDAHEPRVPVPYCHRNGFTSTAPPWAELPTQRRKYCTVETTRTIFWSWAPSFTPGAWSRGMITKIPWLACRMLPSSLRESAANCSAAARALAVASLTIEGLSWLSRVKMKV